MALGSALIGQTTYQGNNPNQGGAITASTLSAPVGGLTESLAGTPTVAYVADTANNRILGYTTVPVSGTITPAAAFVLGQAASSSAVPGTGATSSTAYGLANPSKVSVSDDGRLVVTDTGNNRVLIWNTLPTSAATAPDVIIGQTDINSNQPNMGLTAPTASTLSNPTGAMLNNNKLVVVDQSNNRVLIWNAAVGTLATGSAASVELGQFDNGSGSGFTTSAQGYYYTDQTTGVQSVQFFSPTDVWTDGRSLVVSDTGNNRVLYWSQVPVVNFYNASNVVGQTQFSTTNPGVSNTLLNSPTGVFVSGGNLYVADTVNNRVLEFPSGWQTTNKGPMAGYVFGQQDFTHSAYNDDDQNGVAGDQTNGQSNTYATQNTLHSPSGIFVDNSGNLWVSDRSNNRVIAFSATAGVDGSDTDGAGLVPNCNGYYPLPPDTNYNNN